jgi:hypothetical protein
MMAVRQAIRAVKFPEARDGLPDLSGPPADSDPTPSQPQGYADKGAFYSFVAGLKSEDQAAVLNSVLFAQAVADMNHPDGRNGNDWYNEYTHWLTVQGWVTQDYHWQELSGKNTTFVIQDGILDFLKLAIGEGTRLDILAKVFHVFQNNPNSNEYNLVQSKQTANGGGGFQLGTAGYAQGDAHVNLSSLFTAYHADRQDHNFLWVHWSTTSFSFYAAFNDMILNTDMWNQVKDDVLKKLGSLAKKEIGNVGQLPE